MPKLKSCLELCLYGIRELAKQHHDVNQSEYSLDGPGPMRVDHSGQERSQHIPHQGRTLAQLGAWPQVIPQLHDRYSLFGKTVRQSASLFILFPRRRLGNLCRQLDVELQLCLRGLSH